MESERPIHTNIRANRIQDLRNSIPLGEYIEFPPAMTEVQLQEIPKVTITQEQAEALIQCAVCFHEFRFNENDVRKLPCNHLYHGKCVFPWLQNNPSCPLCRVPLPNQNDEDFEDIIRQHFDMLTRDLMRHLAESGAENGSDSETESQGVSVSVSVTEVTVHMRNGSARTRLRNETPLTTRVSDAVLDRVRVPRRAAFLRADSAIQQIYRSRSFINVSTRNGHTSQDERRPL